MRFTQWLAMPCTVLLSFACVVDQEQDSLDRERYGTTGGGPVETGSASTGYEDGGSDDFTSDGGNAPDVPWEAPTELDASEHCQIVGKPLADLSNPPFKTPSGLWDQNGWGACGYIALINANIASGANDQGGAFEAAVRQCLAGKGIHDANLADGLTKEEMRKVAECKEQRMASSGSPVEIKEVKLVGWFSTDLKQRCADMKAALDAGGSATVSFSGVGGGHAMQVVDVECNEPDQGDVTVTLADPNYPDGQHHEVVINCEDRVESVSPGHFWLAPGAQMFGAMIETPTN